MCNWGYNQGPHFTPFIRIVGDHLVKSGAHPEDVCIKCSEVAKAEEFFQETLVLGGSSAGDL